MAQQSRREFTNANSADIADDDLGAADRQIDRLHGSPPPSLATDPGAGVVVLGNLNAIAATRRISESGNW